MTGERVHGMGGELVPPDWPALTLDEVTPLLQRYGLTARAVLWTSPRPLSAAALVVTDARPVFVKRHATVVRDAAALAEEHAFADHLRSSGVPVPQVLADLDGQRAVPTDSGTFEVHARGTGDDTYRDVMSWEGFRSSRHAYAVGDMLARIALAAKGFGAPARLPRLLVASWDAVAAPSLLPALDAFVAARPLLQAALEHRPWHADAEDAIAPLHEQLLPHLPELPPAWTHGDGHASNFLWRGDGITDVLDLGLSDRTTPLFDLATAIERNCVSWLDPSPVARLDDVDALLAGWSGITDLSGRDRAALAALVPLVHVELALSETAYFSGVTGSAANVALAYDGYLLGHARWFGSDPGRALLERIRRGTLP